MKDRLDTGDSFCGTAGEPVPMRGAVALGLLLTHFVSFLPEIVSPKPPNTCPRERTNTPMTQASQCDRLCGGNRAQQVKK